jgi:hypothetical protein
MSNTVKRFQTAGTVVSTDELNPGTYFVRVTGLYNFGSERRDVESNVTEFTISKSAQLKPPQLKSPYNNKKLLVKNSSTVFNWEKVTEASSYVITISSSSGQSIVNQRVNSNFYNYSRTFPPGSYRWQVTSIGPDGTQSTESSTYNFSIAQNGNITPTSPSRGRQFQPGDRITFNWKDENSGQRYQLQVARDPSFTSIVARRNLSTRSTTLSDIGGGNFHWRVQLLNSQGNAVVTSSTSTFSIVDTLNAPVLISPSNEQFEHNATNTSFRWRQVPNATHYQINIYKRGFPSSTLIKSQKLQSTTFSFNIGSLDSGDYFWTVQALMQEGNQIVLKSQNRQKNFSKKEKKVDPEIRIPEIKSPSTIYIE